MSEIRFEQDGSKGRYVIARGDHEAELTVSIASPRLRIADHTAVPDALRGTGVGRLLVERLVADAREGGWKIMPLCPFVNSERMRHPDWADVFSI